MSVINIETNEFNTTTFTIENINVSIANALRRTIVNDIKTWAFVTSPNEKNNSIFYTNTTKMNNELLKQRLSCIPIHVKYQFVDSMNLEEYFLEVEVENTTDSVMEVTTEHFIVKKKSDRQPVHIDLNREIFPPYIPSEDPDEYYISFVRLNPKISEEIPGEKIHFTCDFSISSASESSMFNVASTCSYGNTVDNEKAAIMLDKLIQEYREQGMTEENIEMETANWKLLNRQRIFKEDSFDFTIQSVGVYSNNNLMYLSIKTIQSRIKEMITDITNGNVDIHPSLSTIDKSYDITFVDDYTLGKALEYVLHKNTDIVYCGYLKVHPHDPESIIRISFHQDFPEANLTLETIHDLLQRALYDLDNIFSVFAKNFLK